MSMLNCQMYCIYFFHDRNIKTEAALFTIHKTHMHDFRWRARSNYNRLPTKKLQFVEWF